MAPCEWVIDIIKEWVLSLAYATQAWVTAKGYSTEAWVEAKGYLTTGFIRRDDPGAWDWTLLNLTANSAWHILDCSGIVPAGAKAILFNQQCANDYSHKSFYLRYPGDPQWNACPGIITQLANIQITRCNVVTCPTDRRIHYRLTTGGWTHAYLQILGWWL